MEQTYTSATLRPFRAPAVPPSRSDHNRSGKIRATITTCPISTPILNAASAGTSAFVGSPISESALAKPKPCTSPKVNVTGHRRSMLREKKFSAATNTIDAAIAGSMIWDGIAKICSAASERVIE